MRGLRLQIVVEPFNKPSRKKNYSEMEMFQMLEIIGQSREDAMVNTIKRRLSTEN
jgi:hypothetical protein